MQAPQNNGSGGSGGASSGGGGCGDGNSQQSLHDMQRFQQQLQAAHFRQQQVLQQQQQQQHFGGNTAVGHLAAMQQQHSGMSASSLASMMQHGSGSSGVSLSSQQQQHHSMSSTSINNIDGGINNSNAYGNWNSLQAQQHQQQLQQAVASPMDASTGSSARLMAMAGRSGMGGNAALAAAAVAASGMHGLGQHSARSSLSNVNTGSSAIQNLQAVLLQQQQAGLGSHHSQLQHRPNLSGIPTTFNPSQQQQQRQLTSPTTASMMGIQGIQGVGLSNTSGVSGNGSSTQQHLLLQQQLAAMQQQQQQQFSGGNGGSGATNAAMYAMQNSMQQQMQGDGNSVQQSNIGTSISMAGPHSTFSALQQQQGMSQQSLLQARQQQLMLQMQQQQRVTSAGDSSTGIDGAASSGILHHMQQPRNSGNQAMLQHGVMAMMQQQQPQLSQPGSGMVHGGQIQSSSNDNASAMMGSNFQQMGLMGNHNLQVGSHNGDHLNRQTQLNGDLSEHSGMSNINDSSSMNEHQLQAQQHLLGSNKSVGNDSDTGGSAGVVSSDQASFLDGRFAGGWQSNADLPERRRVIFNILDVIRQMRPDTSKLSNKLPHMAKSLEEHLYRSAKSKDDYMDLSTLKKRLQAIAHGLEIHRSGDSTGTRQSDAVVPSQHDSSLRSDSATNDGTTIAGQNSNWSVAAAVRSNISGAPSLSGLAEQMNANGNLSVASQLSSSSSQHGNVGLGNATHQGNNMWQQGSASLHVTSSTASPGNFLPMPGPQVAKQESDLYSGGQSSELGNAFSSQTAMLQSQQQQQHGNIFQTNQQQTVNVATFQHNPTHLILSGRQDTSLYSVDLNGPSAQSTFPNASLVGQRESSSSSMGSVGGAPFQNEASDPTEFSSSSKFQDPTASQKMRVILQQQQRLLLLRHASKCNAGPQCSTKFCEQMVTLWKHMKTCRNKNCKTSHCLSSRCVLNHYRICKSNGRTATCEVCGPVMLKIKKQERDDCSVEDPLTRDQDTIALSQPASAATSLYTSQHRQSSSDQSQLFQVQAHQSRLKAQLDSLKLLQKQQEQLLEQQRSLEMQARCISEPNSPQFRQLQEQQILLQQLQKRCQQQQLLVEHELQMQPTDVDVEQAHHFPTTAYADGDPPISTDKLNSHDSEELQKLRRGSGIGKRFDTALGLEGVRRASESDEPGSRKKRGSITKADRSVKKPRGGLKLKAASASEKVKSEKNALPATKKVEDEHTSLLSRMTAAEIQKHLESLNKQIVLSSRTVTHKCRPIIHELLDDRYGWVFRDAVDPVALGLPDYYDVIKNPMHLDLVRKKLENAIYSDMEGFARDTRLVFENAILYNGESSEVGELAQAMMSMFEKLYHAVVHDIECSHLNLESQGELCSLCGVQKRRFEPTVLYCQGKCGMQRIKRNAAYFTDRTKQNHWCDSCFALLDPVEHILLDDGTEVSKKELQEFKNDALPEEGWVNCDECHSWVHQVCALFNGRTNKSSARFTCPSCYLKMPPGEQTPEKALTSVKGPKDLARCKMSDAIEKGLGEALQAAYAARSIELNIAVDEVEKADDLCVRVLSNVEKRQFVGEKMLQRYSAQGYPSEFPVRSKCVALFQRIHGVETLLFAMYVYEYGHDCPAPNRRRVYISYLDSVQYFKPKCYRTTAYHAIIIEYLRYVKKRGFHTASIWSCPPVGGDDYIFYCHPKHQLVPREDMLRLWYHKMLDQAKLQGIVQRTTTLYDEYFTNNGDDPVSGQQQNPTRLPYFEGDYIPGEIENIIHHLDSTGDCTAASPQDRLMVRVGQNLRKMKDNFIVVHLRNRRFAAAVERGEDVSNWKEDSDDEMLRSKRAKISGKCSVEADPLEPIVSLQTVASVEEVSKEGDPSVLRVINEFIQMEGQLDNDGAPRESSEREGTDSSADASVEIASRNDVHIDAVDEVIHAAGSITGAAEAEKHVGLTEHEGMIDIPGVCDEETAAPSERDAAEIYSGLDHLPAPEESEVAAVVLKNEIDSAKNADTGVVGDSSTTDQGCDAGASGGVVCSTVEVDCSKDSGLDHVAGASSCEVITGVDDDRLTTTEQVPAAGTTAGKASLETDSNFASGLDSAGRASKEKVSSDAERDVGASTGPHYVAGTTSRKVNTAVYGEAVATVSPDATMEASSVKIEQPPASCRSIVAAGDAFCHGVTGTGGEATEISDKCDGKVFLADCDQMDGGDQGNDRNVAAEITTIVVVGSPMAIVIDDALKIPAAIASATEATGESAKLSSTYAKSMMMEVVTAGAGADLVADCNKSSVIQTISRKERPFVKELQPSNPAEQATLKQKRALEEIKPAISRHLVGLNISKAPVGDTTDEDPPMESEMFESRQQFLNYCQTTHCQFDELRRAKHSTVMVLFQLHNPMAPKFLQQCGACYRDITHGTRYHCNDCSNFDLCEDCYEPVTSGLWAKRDPRFAHEKKHTFMPVDVEAAEETQKSRAERQKSLKAHIELLEHAGACPGPPSCALHNCERLKKIFLHVPSCDVNPKKYCKICTRLLALCTMHSRLCTVRHSCPIPFCDRIRERNQRLRRQQQLMDDRRRQAQNELYRAGDEV